MQETAYVMINEYITLISVLYLKAKLLPKAPRTENTTQKSKPVSCF